MENRQNQIVYVIIDETDNRNFTEQQFAEKTNNQGKESLSFEVLKTNSQVDKQKLDKLGGCNSRFTLTTLSFQKF